MNIDNALNIASKQPAGIGAIIYFRSKFPVRFENMYFCQFNLGFCD